MGQSYGKKRFDAYGMGQELHELVAHIGGSVRVQLPGFQDDPAPER